MPAKGVQARPRTIPPGRVSSVNGSVHSPHSASSRDCDTKQEPSNMNEQNAGEWAPGVGQLAPTPAWTEMKTKAGKDRKRLPLACKSCRRKKVRCSGETPSCKHCLRSRIPCVYKVTTRKATPRTDYMTMLDKRLKRMEERVIKLIPTNEQGKMSAIGRACVKPPNIQSSRQAATKKRAAIDAFANDLEDSSKFIPRAQDSSDTSSFMEGVECLPSVDIQEHLAEVYFDYCYGQPYQLLHKPSFMRRLKAGSIPPVLMLGVCAISARFSTHPSLVNEPGSIRGEQWAKSSREIAAKSFADPNMTIVIVVILLALHDFGGCQGGRAWMYAGIAMRMCYALQLNVEYDHATAEHEPGKQSELSFTDQEIRRRTMWACFLIDSFNASGTKRPSFDHLQYIKIQLPVKESHFQMEIPGRTEDIRGNPSSGHVLRDGGDNLLPQDNMGIAAYLVKCLVLWSSVVTYVNSAGMESDNIAPWDPESQFTKLKRKVLAFPRELPSSMHYSTEALHKHDGDKVGGQFAFMHVIYQQILLFLHKFAVPAFPNAKMPPGTPTAFRNEARHSAVMAATKISSILNDARDTPLTAPFASYCTFASCTVHIWGMFSTNEAVRESSKMNLTTNMHYLTRMKKHWSMVHYMTEGIKDMYRQHADASRLGNIQSPRGGDDVFFDYGDFIERENPESIIDEGYKNSSASGKHPNTHRRLSVLSSQAELQSVGDWFRQESPRLEKVDMPSRPVKRGRQSHEKPEVVSEPLAATTSAMPPVLKQEMHPLHQFRTPQFSAAPNPYQQMNPNTYDHQGFASRLPLQAYDRQLVFGAYAQDPTPSFSMVNAQYPTSMAAMTVGQDPVTSMGVDSMNNFGDASGAWLTPFHLVPPVNLVQPEFPVENDMTFPVGANGHDFWNTGN